MRYGNVIPAAFIDRPNRFIAHVEIGGRRETVHVKNTGRCRELLVPGAEVILEDFRDRIYEAFPKMTYVDLGSDPVFYDEYMSAQFLPHTDDSKFPSVKANRL